jgi:predicted MPP superfamily phosphohydrolase
LSLQVGFKYFPFKEIELKPRAFSHSISSLKIVQLSDLHLHKKVKLDYLKSLVEKINALSPDLVVFTGDIIQTPSKNILEQLQVFKNFDAPTYYVTGNHDIFYGSVPLKKTLEDNGVICLDNDVVKLNINGENIQLVGISDRYSFAKGIKRPIKELYASLDKDMFTLLLAHQPKDISHIKDTRIDIQLSGHTHGGQVFPFNYLVRLVQPYFRGLYTHNKTLLYVTSGLGYWGVGFRYKVQSEIPVIRVT